MKINYLLEGYVSEKKCNRCGEIKDISLFGIDKRRPDGFRGICKECQKPVNVKKYQENAEAEKKAIAESGNKRCASCRDVKPLTEFGNDKSKKDGLNQYCKVCMRERAKKDREDNPEKFRLRHKKRYESNPEKMKDNNKRFKDANPEYFKNYREDNVEKRSASAKKDREDNPEKFRLRHKEYQKRKRDSDIVFKLCCNVRRRLSSALKNKQKKGSGVRDLGCTGQYLSDHLESLFTEGMSWENYGNKKGQWSIDHIMPMSAFNLEDRQHLLLACNYLNLQPMWHAENMRKNDSLPHKYLKAA